MILDSEDKIIKLQNELIPLVKELIIKINNYKVFPNDICKVTDILRELISLCLIGEECIDFAIVYTNKIVSNVDLLNFFTEQKSSLDIKIFVKNININFGG